MSDVVEKLKEAQLDVNEFYGLHVLIECIPQIVDTLMEKIKDYYKAVGEYKYISKKEVNTVLSATEKYSRYFWRDVCKKEEHVGVQYGDLTEDIVNAMLVIDRFRMVKNVTAEKGFTELSDNINEILGLIYTKYEKGTLNDFINLLKEGEN